MSALTAPRERETKAGSSRPTLRAVRSSSRPLARAPFLILLGVILVAGMVGVLILNTSLQNQAFEVRDLQRQAAELGYERAALDAELDAVSSPESLAKKASRLGMRPNPYAAFVDLGSGKVVGKPQTVKGNEVPEVVARSGDEIRAAQIEKRRKQQAAAVERERKRLAAEKAAAEKAAAEKAKQEKADKATTKPSADPSTKQDGNR